MFDRVDLIAAFSLLHMFPRDFRNGYNRLCSIVLLEAIART